jgi:hypothetical protein
MADTTSPEHRLYNLISQPEWSHCRPDPHSIAKDDQIIDLTRNSRTLVTVDSN